MVPAFNRRFAQWLDGVSKRCAPVAWSVVGWGLNSITSGWGNYSRYCNPYYAVSAVAQAVPYDYSQPTVINNYVSSDSHSAGGDAQSSQSSTADQAGLTAFDNGLAKFKLGSYRESLADFNVALKPLPNDAVVNEARCLALFAVADYAGAAAGLNSLLSAAPGMDWTTMSGLYGDVNDYTTQLRALERFCDSKPTDASSHFVLAYHYLVTGSQEAAIDELKVVVKNQPKDVTAKLMLEALVPPMPPAVMAPVATAPSEIATTNEPETDLVGSWVAQARDIKIELSVAEDSQFVWKAGGTNQAAVRLSGQLSSSGDGIELTTAEQGTIAGIVTSKGLNSWNFAITGSESLSSLQRAIEEL